MIDQNIVEIELGWYLMTPMEQSLWGLSMALHNQDQDAGLGAADTALARLRSVTDARSRRPEPESEAARSNIVIPFEQFAAWYPVAYRLRHRLDRDYQEPSDEQIRTAYERYDRGLCDYY